MVANNETDTAPPNSGQSDAHSSNHEITIVVDGTERQLTERKWVVRDLKAKLELEAAKVLAQITPHGLKDLNDDSVIELHEKEQFMTHARSGGSS